MVDVKTSAAFPWATSSWFDYPSSPSPIPPNTPSKVAPAPVSEVDPATLPPSSPSPPPLSPALSPAPFSPRPAGPSLGGVPDGGELSDGPLEAIAGSIPRRRKVEERKVFSNLDGSIFKVRGLTYIHDRIKIHSAHSLCYSRAADLLNTPHKIFNVSSLKTSIASRLPDSQFMVFNFVIPVNPCTQLVYYLELPDPSTLTETDHKVYNLVKRFMDPHEKDEFRTSRLKLIPIISEGPWLVRKGIPTAPALVATKLATSYHWGANYFEIDIDVGSTKAGCAFWGLINKALSGLNVDLAFLIEGRNEAELPEQILGAVRFHHPCFDTSMMRKLEPWEYEDNKAVLTPPARQTVPTDEQAGEFLSPTALSPSAAIPPSSAQSTAETSNTPGVPAAAAAPTHTIIAPTPVKATVL